MTEGQNRANLPVNVPGSATKGQNLTKLSPNVHRFPGEPGA